MNTKHIIIIALAMCGLHSCTADLDQSPHTDSQSTAAAVYSTEEGYRQALAKLYASFVITGQEQGGGNADLASNSGYDFLRGYFNLQEAPTDEMAATWLSGDKIEGLTYMTWDASDPWVADTYYRAYYTIALCNRELFAYRERELKDIAADGLSDPGNCEYGRASKAAAWALLAKLYLNAEVYGAGTHYTDCITCCKKIVSAGFSLEQDYGKLFNADNDKRTNEIIFPLVVDAVHTVSWGATTYIVCGECGNTSTQNPARYGLTNGWGMFRVRGELPQLFAGREKTDRRYRFYTDGQEQWLGKGIDNQSEGYFGEKYSNLTDAGEPASNTGAAGCSIDYPVFRLADVYLMLAESVLRGGQGSSLGEALQYVNRVRERASGSTGGDITAAQLTLKLILDERGRELYWECTRRTDLIRYGLFTGGGYKWQWKGGVADGRATDSRYNVYPIPTAELSANPNLSNENY